MSQQIGSMHVSLTADVKPYASAMQAAEAQTARSSAAIRRSLGLAETSVQRLGRTAGGGFRVGGLMAASRAFESVADRANLLRASILGVAYAAGGLGSALASNILLRYADSATKVANQIRTVADSTADLKAQQQALLQTANANRSALGATATLYTRIRRAMPSEAAENVLGLTSTIQQALQLGGASAQEAASAMIQLSQGLASNRLQGEELRAILETPLGGFLAKGLGVDIGALREMGKEGRLTADVVVAGLKRVAPEIQSAFAKSTKTVDQALTVADNNLTDYVGRVDESYGVTRRLSEAIITLSENLDELGYWAGWAGLAFGSIFAARGPLRIVDAFKELRAAAKTELQAAAADVKRLQDSLTGAEQASGSASLRQTMLDPRKAADPAAVKAYKREVAALTKAEGQRADTISRIVALEQERNAVSAETATASTKALSLADRLTKAEAEQAKQVQRLQDARRRMAAIRSAESTAGVSMPRFTEQAAREAESAKAAIERSQQQIIESTKRIGELRVQADQEAANKRIEIERRVLAEKVSLAERERAIAVGRVRVENADRAVGASGSLNLAADATRSASAVQALRGELAQATAKLTLMQRAASVTGVALRGLALAGSSLLAFLGGPWGIAFSAAIGGLIWWQMESAKAQAATDAYKQRLIDLGYVANTTATNIRDMGKARLEAIQAERNTARTQMAGFQEELTGIADAQTGRSGNLRLATTIRDFTAMKISADEFNRRLDEIAARDQKGLMAGTLTRVRELAGLIAGARKDAAELDKQASAARSNVLSGAGRVPADRGDRAAAASDIEFTRRYREELYRTQHETKVLAEQQRILKAAEEDGRAVSEALAKTLAEERVAYEELQDRMQQFGVVQSQVEGAYKRLADAIRPYWQMVVDLNERGGFTGPDHPQPAPNPVEGMTPEELGRPTPEIPIPKPNPIEGMTPDELKSAYEKMIESANREITTLEVLQRSLGMTKVETEALEKAMEMLNQAQQENGSLTPEQQQQIIGLASKMTVLKTEVDAARERMQDLGETAKQGFEGLAKSIGEAIARGGDFKDVLRQIVGMLVELGAKWLGAKLFPTGGGAGAPSAASVSDAVTKAIGSPTASTSSVLGIPKVKSALGGIGSDARFALGSGDVKSGFLDAIASVESGGRYDIRYGGVGSSGKFFDPANGHPRVFERTRSGDVSSAAGAYQITASTFDDYGGGAFDPASQRAMAWRIAEDRAAPLTGGNLQGYLSQNGFDSALVKQLGPTWEGLQVNGAKAMQTFTEATQKATSGLGSFGTKITDVVSNSLGGGGATNAIGGKGPVDLGALAGEGGGIGGLLNSIVGSLGDMLKNLLGGLGNVLKSVFSSIFGGFFATGGSLPAGKVGIVGERGPELVKGTGKGLDVIPLSPGQRASASMSGRTGKGHFADNRRMVFAPQTAVTMQSGSQQDRAALLGDLERRDERQRDWFTRNFTSMQLEHLATKG